MRGFLEARILQTLVLNFVVLSGDFACQKVLPDF
jgi:hypothetical protein